MTKFNIAVVGATGNIGREILSIIKEINFPHDKVYALASTDTIGKEVSFGDIDVLKIIATENFNFSDAHIVFFAVDEIVSSKYVEKAVQAGCIVIDCSSFSRLKSNIPLIVPEINSDKMTNDSNLIANPSSIAIMMSLLLNPLHEEFGVSRVVASTYQSVSCSGKDAMDELFHQTKGLYVHNIPDPKIFDKRIAFNIIPKIGNITANGYTSEEQNIINEVKKIIDNDIGITVTCVRVPVFVGHSCSINIELEEDVSKDQFISLIKKNSSLEIIAENNNENYITPIETIQEDMIYLSRIRKDNSRKACFEIWLSTDNVRKTAFNAINIAKEYVNQSGIIN